MDVLHAAIGDDAAEGILHGGRGGTDAVIAVDRHPDVAQRGCAWRRVPDRHSAQS